MKRKIALVLSLILIVGIFTFPVSAVPSVKLSKKSVTVCVGETVKVKADASYKNVKIKWKSGNISVAKVSSTGKIQGVKAGKTTVTASFVYKGKTYSAKCKVNVKKPYVKLNYDSLTLYTGGTKTLKATFLPKSGEIKWKSSDKTVVKVFSSGKVTALKKGKATISASFKYNGKTYSAKCKVTVKNPSIKINSKSEEIFVGDAVSLKATVTPSSQKVSWSSSNKAVAKVNSNGKVTAIKAGTATITAKFTYGGKTYSSNCKIKVKKHAISVLAVYDLEENDYYITHPAIEYINNTDKYIVTVKFEMELFDENENLVYDNNGYGSLGLYDNSGANPSETVSSSWSASYTYEAVHGMYLKRAIVTFEDGSTETVNTNTVYWDRCCYSHVDRN